MSELTVIGWREVWLIAAWIALVTSAAFLAGWRSLVWDRSWQQQWLALAAYCLLFVAGGALAVKAIDTANNGGGDVFSFDYILYLRSALFIIAILLAQRYFQCGWPAAVWLAIATLLFSLLALGV